MESIFENHSLYNKYLSVDGMRVSEGGTKPSLYISELKLNKALKDLTDIEIENLHDKEMPAYAIRLKRESISKKISNLLEWQLLCALHLLLEEGSYKSISYVIGCKRTDTNPNG